VFILKNNVLSHVTGPSLGSDRRLHAGLVVMFFTNDEKYIQGQNNQWFANKTWIEKRYIPHDNTYIAGLAKVKMKI
jgi:hypothetical protein